MAEIILRPTGAGASAEHDHQAGAGAHWQLLSDESDATHIWHEEVVTFPVTDCYTHDALGIPAGLSITKVECYARVKHDFSIAWVASIHLGFRIDGNNYSLLVGHDNIFGVFNEKLLTWENNPETGHPWTVAELDGLQFAVITNNPGWQANKFGYIADIYYVVTYTIVAPTVTTDPATGVTTVAANPNGTLDNDGGEACDCGFQWGETVAYGNTTPTQSKTTGQTFTQSLSGLDPNKTYHFRAFATNSAGTGYGADRTFVTLAIVLPTITTDPATDVEPTSATENGTLDGDGGEACDCGFEWGLTAAYGNTTPTQSKTTGQSFSWGISGLSPSTLYHFRAFATNAAGTSYGVDRTFTTGALPPAVIAPDVTTDPATRII